MNSTGEDSMIVRVVTRVDGAAALETLRTVVVGSESDDPMAPVTVVAPNDIVGIVARRRLATGTPERPVVAGIGVTTLARLAERIVTPLLAPRRSATRTVVAAAWRPVRDLGWFADIAATQRPFAR